MVDWFRIDKGDGQMMVVTGLAVYRAAAGHFRDPAEVLRAGRFVTPFAVYTTRDLLTDAERKALITE